MMENLLAEKVAMVTGGGSGIGAATARLLSSYGASIVVSDINDTDGQKVAHEIVKAGGQASYIHADVSQPTDCEWLVSTTIGLYGRLNIAFNNAGISGEANKVIDMSIEGWQKAINTNLNSVFYCMKYQLAQMVAQGGGSIINNSSILGAVGFAGSAAYAASKHALIGLTQTAAIEYGALGVRINCIGPAFINTPLLTAAGMDEATKQLVLVPLHPIGRLGEPKEVAELVAWLASDKASFVTGSYYPVDGGYLAK